MAIYYVYGWLFAATPLAPESSTQGKDSLVFMFEPFAATPAHQSHINLTFRMFRVCRCFGTVYVTLTVCALI